MVEIDCARTEQTFAFPSRLDGDFSIIRNGESITTDRPGKLFWKFFDSLVRIAVAEWAKTLIFVHAGCVGWRDKAIILPANSFYGKTTFVAELVRHGAIYYSDEYAVFDESGLVLPFARRLSLRSDGNGFREAQIDAEELGGVKGQEPIPLGLVFITRFVANCSPEYEFLTAGQGAVEVIPQTIGIRRNTAFALKVLKNALSDAIIVKSPRPDAGKYAREFLEFVDRTAF